VVPYSIRVEGKHFIIKVNGEFVNGLLRTRRSRPRNPLPLTGTVAIQARDPKSVVHYKSTRLR